ncbi:MAG: hypothetical protein K6G81_02160 [Lachnospiraceae bacterium]|nr:hypothetical protein [Lachnospiraceae bacterium]
MYKAQMKFQKIVCYVALIASALVFVYSLGLMTDLYDSLYQMMPDPADASSDYVEGARIFYDMQDFNRALTRAGIILILLAVFILIMNTHIRRRYYAGNYVAACLFTAAGIGFSIWALKNLAAYKEQFLTTIDFEMLAFWAEIWNSTYTESTFWFDIGKAVFGILLISVCLIVVNMIWKISVTKAEKNLIDQGKGARVNG